jgi:hypothetical protein
LDWIENYLANTTGIASPEQFRLWSAITGVSGALERRVWSETMQSRMYPGIYTLLVGAPGSGKTTAIRPVQDIWRKIRGLAVAPDNVTKPVLIEALARSMRVEFNENMEMEEPCSALCVACSEFGVFFTNHDLEFISVLNFIYDDPPKYREERITIGVREAIRPHLTILGGTQPDYLGTFMPEQAWGMGFAKRLIMIYGAVVPPIKDIFVSQNGHDWISELADGLTAIFQMKGKFEWTEEARNEINAWYHAGQPPRPDHNRLAHYCSERPVYLIKLSMISAASRTQSLVVEIEDFERARDWLLSAETLMPDIFHAMSSKSDSQVIDDLHQALWQKWAVNRPIDRRDIDEEILWRHLKEKVTSDRIPRIIDAAVKMGAIKAGNLPGTYVPCPLVER